MLQKSLIAMAVVAGIGFGGTSAQAAAVTYSFAGVIDTSDTSLPSNFQQGQTFTGTFSVDPTVLPGTPNNGEQFVYEALTSFSVDFGGYTATKTANPGEEVQVDLHGGPQSLTDRYGVIARGISGGDIGGFTIDSIVSLVLFTSPGENVLPAFTAADSTPPLPTDLSGFNLTESGFFFALRPTGIVPADGAGAIDVSGHLTQLTSVPEPGSLTLVAIGMTAIGGTWLRRRRLNAQGQRRAPEHFTA
jgi:hypothetical protein